MTVYEAMSGKVKIVEICAIGQKLTVNSCIFSPVSFAHYFSVSQIRHAELHVSVKLTKVRFLSVY
jgi:hypothetical protein